MSDADLIDRIYEAAVIPGLWPQVLDALAAISGSAGAAKVARSVAGGRTLDQHAADEGVSRETVRTHLKKVFQKCGVSRQSDLAMILSKDISGHRLQETDS